MASNDPVLLQHFSTEIFNTANLKPAAVDEPFFVASHHSKDLIVAVTEDSVSQNTEQKTENPIHVRIEDILSYIQGLPTQAYLHLGDFHYKQLSKNPIIRKKQLKGHFAIHAYKYLLLAIRNQLPADGQPILLGCDGVYKKDEIRSQLGPIDDLDAIIQEGGPRGALAQWLKNNYEPLVDAVHELRNTDDTSETVAPVIDNLSCIVEAKMAMKLLPGNHEWASFDTHVASEKALQRFKAGIQDCANDYANLAQTLAKAPSIEQPDVSVNEHPYDETKRTDADLPANTEPTLEFVTTGDIRYNVFMLDSTNLADFLSEETAQALAHYLQQCLSQNRIPMVGMHHPIKLDTGKRDLHAAAEVTLKLDLNFAEVFGDPFMEALRHRSKYDFDTIRFLYTLLDEQLAITPQSLAALLPICMQRLLSNALQHFDNPPPEKLTIHEFCAHQHVTNYAETLYSALSKQGYAVTIHTKVITTQTAHLAKKHAHQNPLRPQQAATDGPFPYPATDQSTSEDTAWLDSFDPRSGHVSRTDLATGTTLSTSDDDPNNALALSALEPSSFELRRFGLPQIIDQEGLCDVLLMLLKFDQAYYQGQLFNAPFFDKMDPNNRLKQFVLHIGTPFAGKLSLAHAFLRKNTRNRTMAKMAQLQILSLTDQWPDFCNQFFQHLNVTPTAESYGTATTSPQAQLQPLNSSTIANKPLPLKYREALRFARVGLAQIRPNIDPLPFYRPGKPQGLQEKLLAALHRMLVLITALPTDGAIKMLMMFYFLHELFKTSCLDHNFDPATGYNYSACAETNYYNESVTTAFPYTTGTSQAYAIIGIPNATNVYFQLALPFNLSMWLYGLFLLFSTLLGFNHIGASAQLTQQLSTAKKGVFVIHAADITTRYMVRLTIALFSMTELVSAFEGDPSTRVTTNWITGTVLFAEHLLKHLIARPNMQAPFSDLTFAQAMQMLRTTTRGKYTITSLVPWTVLPRLERIALISVLIYNNLSFWYNILSIAGTAVLLGFVTLLSATLNGLSFIPHFRAQLTVHMLGKLATDALYFLTIYTFVTSLLSQWADPSKDPADVDNNPNYHIAIRIVSTILALHVLGLVMHAAVSRPVHQEHHSCAQATKVTKLPTEVDAEKQPEGTRQRTASMRSRLLGMQASCRPLTRQQQRHHRLEELQAWADILNPSSRPGQS